MVSVAIVSVVLFAASRIVAHSLKTSCAIIDHRNFYVKPEVLLGCPESERFGPPPEPLRRNHGLIYCHERRIATPDSTYHWEEVAGPKYPQTRSQTEGMHRVSLLCLTSPANAIAKVITSPTQVLLIFKENARDSVV
ncbi:hypothetical protein BDV35DRAFT_335779 [Aspergillus flavus]|uniref:Secreted protein n=1 Tax=Aspergillus flavus TaxID=5059 RepID=A0A5N6HEH3_ASPFL|nr:hypothetical protein BDV35DRAFT_335779 [Aspergillus flavus]